MKRKKIDSLALLGPIWFLTKSESIWRNLVTEKRWLLQYQIWEAFEIVPLNLRNLFLG